ncbi:MAG TPA: hypothetical protein VMU94_24550, partial [Streptosporangiaceae bacterium]|nr:hypothetical protein [Streptosporangiaceae bacterium]
SLLGLIVIPRLSCGFPGPSWLPGRCQRPGNPIYLTPTVRYDVGANPGPGCRVGQGHARV